MLNGFVDSLLQSFENHRAGLADTRLGTGGEEAFFLEVYEKEVPRLRGMIQDQELALAEPSRAAFFGEVDEYVRRVVVPAYARLAGRFTRDERNDFYLTPPSLHGLERLGWAAAGLLLGLFVVWAPFIPIWSKEWVLVFAVGGFVFPNLRRFLALRRYESELNRLVMRADDEIWRKDLAYVTEGAMLRATPPDLAAESEPGADDALADRLASAKSAETPEDGRGNPKVRQGGR
jgi:hypothetical protein